jgi:hypothetical protein
MNLAKRKLQEATPELARKISARIKASRKFQPLKWSQEIMPDGAQIWDNDLYSVTVRIHKDGWPLGGGPWVQLGISCHDGEPRHDWRDFQAIKNQLCGPEYEAVELYPAESRLLDPSNYFILFCAPKIPLGIYQGRRFSNATNCMAPQRAWAKGEEPPEATQAWIKPPVTPNEL